MRRATALRNFDVLGCGCILCFYHSLFVCVVISRARTATAQVAAALVAVDNMVGRLVRCFRRPARGAIAKCARELREAGNATWLKQASSAKAQAQHIFPDWKCMCCRTPPPPRFVQHSPPLAPTKIIRSIAAPVASDKIGENMAVQARGIYCPPRCAVTHAPPLVSHRSTAWQRRASWRTRTSSLPPTTAWLRRVLVARVCSPFVCSPFVCVVCVCVCVCAPVALPC